MATKPDNHPDDDWQAKPCTPSVSPTTETPPDTMSLDIKLRQLSTPQAVLLRNVTLHVPPGVIHSVMGASGSGKSSLLAAICGTLPEGLRFDGEIALNGQRLDHLPTERRRRRDGDRDR